MRGKGDRFFLPTPQSEKRSYTNAAKTGGVGPLRTIQAIIKIAFWAGSMQFCVNGALIRLLVDNKSLAASTDDWDVILDRHRTHFD